MAGALRTNLERAILLTSSNAAANETVNELVR
jgi:hypothetical protein